MITVKQCAPITLIRVCYNPYTEKKICIICKKKNMYSELRSTGTINLLTCLKEVVANQIM